MNVAAAAVLGGAAEVAVGEDWARRTFELVEATFQGTHCGQLRTIGSRRDRFGNVSAMAKARAAMSNVAPPSSFEVMVPIPSPMARWTLFKDRLSLGREAPQDC